MLLLRKCPVVFWALFVIVQLYSFGGAAQSRPFRLIDYGIIIPDDGKYDVVKERDYDGYISVQKDGRYGVLDRKLREVIPCKYDKQIDFSDGFSIVDSGFLQGLYDSSGRVILPCAFSSIIRDIRAFGDAQFVVYDDRKCFRLLGRDGSIVSCDSLDVGGRSGATGPSVDTNANGLDLSVVYTKTHRKVHKASVLGSSGHYIGYDGRRYGVVSPKGEEIFPFEFDGYFICSVPDLVCLKKSQLWGCVNFSTGRVVMPFEYDRIKCITGSNGIFYREKGSKHELVDLESRVWDTKGFSIVKAFASDIFEATVPDEYGIRKGCINRKCDTLLRFTFWKIKGYYNGYFRVNYHNYDVMVDAKGNELPYEIRPADTFKEGLIELINPARKGCGDFYNYPRIYMDTLCQIVRKYPKGADYMRFDCFHNGMARVVDDEGYIGYVDRAGKNVVPCIYEDADDFYEGRARIGKDNRWRYINSSGKVMSDSIFLWAGNFKEGRACVSYTSGGAGYIDTNGLMVTPSVYEDCLPYFNGFSSVKKDGKWGLINRSGYLVIDCRYDWPLVYSEGLVALCENGRWSYTDTFGRIMVRMPDSISYCSAFVSGSAYICAGEKFGLIDTSGVITVPVMFTDLGGWHNKFIKYAIGDEKYGLMSRRGAKITPPMYRDMYFSEKSDFIVVSDTYGYGVIDINAREIVPAVFEDINPDYFGEGLMKAKLNGKWGYLTESGAVKVPFIYDDATVFSEGLAAVKKDGKWGLVNKAGKVAVWLR